MKVSSIGQGTIGWCLPTLLLTSTVRPQCAHLAETLITEAGLSLERAKRRPSCNPPSGRDPSTFVTSSVPVWLHWLQLAASLVGRELTHLAGMFQDKPFTQSAARECGGTEIYVVATVRCSRLSTGLYSHSLRTSFGRHHFFDTHPPASNSTGKTPGSRLSPVRERPIVFLHGMFTNAQSMVPLAVIVAHHTQRYAHRIVNEPIHYHLCRNHPRPMHPNTVHPSIGIIGLVVYESCSIRFHSHTSMSAHAKHAPGATGLVHQICVAAQQRPTLRIRRPRAIAAFPL